MRCMLIALPVVIFGSSLLVASDTRSENSSGKGKAKFGDYVGDQFKQLEHKLMDDTSGVPATQGR